jgi:hypothetical protein
MCKSKVSLNGVEVPYVPAPPSPRDVPAQLDPTSPCWWREVEPQALGVWGGRLQVVRVVVFLPEMSEAEHTHWELRAE